MLITTPMGLRMTDGCDRDPRPLELLTTVFKEKPDLMRSRTKPKPEP